MKSIDIKEKLMCPDIIILWNTSNLLGNFRENLEQLERLRRPCARQVESRHRKEKSLFNRVVSFTGKFFGVSTLD